MGAVPGDARRDVFAGAPRGWLGHANVDKPAYPPYNTAGWRGVAPPPPSNPPTVARSPWRSRLQSPAHPRPRAGPTRAGNTAPPRRGEARMVEPADAPDPASRERSLEGVESLLLHRCHIRRRTDPFALQRIRETGGPALPRFPALRPPVPPISRAGEPAPPSGVGFRSRSPRSGDRPEPPTGPKRSSGVDWIPAPEGVRNEVSTCGTQTVTPITALGYAVCRVDPAASFRACHHSIPLLMDRTICANEVSRRETASARREVPGARSRRN